MKSLDIDFSNVDLKNFKYFRPASTTPPPAFYIKSLGVYVRPLPRRESPFETAFKKTRAVYEYFKQVLAGDPLANMRLNIRFDPDFAARNAPLFQKHYGYRGERLVDLLGRGANLKELEYYGAVPRKKMIQRNRN